MGDSPALMVLHVNPMSGSDRHNGSQTHPFKTLTHGLTVAIPGTTTLQLSPGTYSTDTGEQFPIHIPVGVTVRGHTPNAGRGFVISGGGTLISPDFGKQCITLTLEDEACLSGVTVTNPQPGGTGVWIESTRSAIAHCTLEHCSREGVFVTGTARVTIHNSVFQHNGASGLSMVRQAKGHIQGNQFRHTGYGIVISDRAMPLLVENVCLANRVGIVVARLASPVLRQNRIEANSGDGMLVSDAAQPDLGHPHNPGGNRFSANGNADLRHLGSAALRSVGNLLSPVRVIGVIAFGATQTDAQTDDQTDMPGGASRPPSPFFAPVAVEPTPILPPLAHPRSALPSVTLSLSTRGGHWASPFIRALANRGVLRSVPEDPAQLERQVTRSEYAVLLSRAFSLPARSAMPDFHDLDSGHWATAAIASAVQAGFLAGFPDGNVRPQQPVPRWEAIASVVTGLGLSGGTLMALACYRDRAEIPSQGALAMATATQRGLVVNYPHHQTLRPMAAITQAELATLLYQALVVTLQATAIASPYQVSAEPAGLVFSDIGGHWAAEFIQGVAHHGVMTGYADGTFRPNVPITRADLAVLLAALFNHLPERAAPAFKDILPEHWAAAAITRSFRLGLMAGFDDQTFRPNQTVTRLQVILALVNGLELPLDQASEEVDAPSYARSAIASAIAHRLVVSFPDPHQLALTRVTTRAEAAVMLYQALSLQGRSPSLSSAFLVTTVSGQPPAQHGPRRVVVLDAGHGGSDTGATDSHGLLEKDITLALCQAIATQLRQSPHLRVVLTRIDDQTLSDQQRLNTIQRARADLLVSLHLGATAPSNPTLNGLRTCYGEASEQSQAIAQALHAAILTRAQLRDQGIVPTQLPLLQRSAQPALQLEVGAADYQFLTDPNGCAPLAAAIAHSIQHLVMPKG